MINIIHDIIIMVTFMIMKDGYLDEKYKNLIHDNKKTNSELYKLLYDFNKLLHKILYNFNGIEINNENNYIVPAFAKLVKLYQSCVILIEYGMTDISENILRSIYDLKFQMLYVFEKENNYQRLLKSLFSKELNILNNAEKYKLYDLITQEQIESYREKIKTNLQELEEIKCAPDTKTMCEELRLQEEYIYYYFLCNETHQSCDVIYSLNTSKGIDIQPKYDKVYEISLKLIASFEHILEKIINKYTPYLQEEYRSMAERYKSFIETTEGNK